MMAFVLSQKGWWWMVTVSALILAGAAAYCQLVQYPRFRTIPVDRFGRFHEIHCAIIGLIVGIPILLEPVLAALLVLSAPSFASGAGLILCLAGHGLTFRYSAPAHAALSRAYSDAMVDQLLRTNWMRAWAWAGHAALGLFMAIAHGTSN